MARVVDLRKQKPPEPRSSRPLPLREPQAPRPRIPPRREPLRARRARRRFIVALAVILLFIAAAAGVSYASYLPALNIETVTIEGSNAVPASDIQSFALSRVKTGGHPFISPHLAFLFDPAPLEQAIVAQFPRLSSAQVTRASLFATDLTITVSERQAYALWCEPDGASDGSANSDATSSTDAYDPDLSGGPCYDIDETGFIFAAAPDVPDVIPDSAASSTDATSTAAASSSEQMAPPTSSGYVFSGGLVAPASATSTASSTIADADAGPIGDSFVPQHIAGIVALLGALGQDGFTPSGAQVSNDGQDFSVPLQQGFYLKASFGENPQTLAQNLQLVLSSSALQGQENDLDYVDLRFGDKVYYELKGGTNTATQ